MITENDISIALNELYKRVGTQKALSELAGITQSTICAYLNGKAKIENMPVGIFLRLFRDMKINFFGEKSGDDDTDRRRNTMLNIFNSLTPDEQMAAIAMLAANFGENIRKETKSV